MATDTQAESQLPGHSLKAPPVVNQLGADWFLAGTVIPSTRSLVLSPGVPNRMGHLWSKYPLLTNDFEIQLEFSAKGPAQRTVKEDGFAIWYVHENVSDAVSTLTDKHLHSQEEIIANSWTTAFAADSYDLFGYRSKFDGFGVFLCNDGVPTIGGLANDGKSSYTLHSGVPAADTMQHDFRNKDKVSLNVRVRPKSVTVAVAGGPTQEIKADMRTGGYLGISIYGGIKGRVEASEKSDFIELWKFAVVNHDASAQGEYLPSKAQEPATPAPVKEDLIGDSSSFKDHRAESEAIKELTNMVFKLVVESQPMRTQMIRAIDSLGKRVTAMEKTFENLKVELDKRTGHHLSAEFDAIKKELTSLSKVASTETQERHKKLDSLHEDIAHVHKSATSQDNLDHHLSKLTESNKRTIDNLTNEHQKMFGVSIAAVAFIVIGGLSLYNKFRCWEKKHVL
jgi:hypothetical protein